MKPRQMLFAMTVVAVAIGAFAQNQSNRVFESSEPSGGIKLIPIAELSPESYELFGKHLTAEKRKKYAQQGKSTRVHEYWDNGISHSEYWVETWAAQLKRTPQSLDPGKFAFPLADISKSKLSKYKLLGLKADGGSVPPTMALRFFETPGGEVLLLQERAYVLDGGGATMAKEAINSDVNGQLAVFSKHVSASGKSVWKLRWFNDSVIYDLYLVAPKESDAGPPDMLDIASSVAQQVRR